MPQLQRLQSGDAKLVLRRQTTQDSITSNYSDSYYSDDGWILDNDFIQPARSDSLIIPTELSFDPNFNPNEYYLSGFAHSFIKFF